MLVSWLLSVSKQHYVRNLRQAKLAVYIVQVGFVAYMLSCIFSNRSRGVSKFVDCKELHFKRKANCGSHMNVLANCISFQMCNQLCAIKVVHLNSSRAFYLGQQLWHAMI